MIIVLMYRLKLLKSKFSRSILFNEDTGESEFINDLYFYYYYPQMILVDEDFCKPEKWFKRELLLFLL